jgi:hypothetical protein
MISTFELQGTVKLVGTIVEHGWGPPIASGARLFYILSVVCKWRWRLKGYKYRDTRPGT